jgi:arylsulfatase A-like enzyme
VILLDLDTFRGDRLDPTAKNPLAPTLCDLARGGVYFPNCFAQAPRTLPSQMSILTSRYVSGHGVGGAGAWALADTIRSVTECFRDAGYQTAGFVDGGWVGARHGFDKGFDVFDEQAGRLQSILPRVESWLSNRSEKPFFLWIHSYDTHSPYHPPCHEETASTGGPRSSAGGTAALLSRADVDRVISHGPDSLGAERDSILHLMRNAYDHSVTCADGWVAELLASLERTSCRKNTILVLISDHGEAFLEHGIFLHNTLHREIIHVPFFVSFPDDSSSLAIDPGIVQTIDVAPTILELAGIAVPDEFVGTSLADRCARRRSARPATGAAAAFAEGFSKDVGRLTWSILTDRDHMILWYNTGRCELYSWREDPEEKRNRAAQEPETVEALRERLMAWVREHAIEAVGHPVEEVPEGMSEEKIEELRGLGYIR